MAKSFKWNRTKERASIGRQMSKNLTSIFPPRPYLEISKGVIVPVEKPFFQYSHAIYNDGSGAKLYKVAGVVNRRGGDVSKESLILEDPSTGLKLKPVLARAVKGAKVLNQRQ